MAGLRLGARDVGLIAHRGGTRDIPQRAPTGNAGNAPEARPRKHAPNPVRGAARPVWSGTRPAPPPATRRRTHSIAHHLAHDRLRRLAPRAAPSTLPSPVAEAAEPQRSLISRALPELHMTVTSSAPAPEAASARQQEMPLAVVQGQPVLQLPQDLYIPPDALEVILEAFEGPLDLLLYLIRRQNLDILDIPVAEITRQYVAYIEVMHELRFELAAEYLVMAAILAEIKSRMLLPRPAGDGDAGEDDPRAELVRRLQEYERFRQAAEDLDRLPRMERDTSPVQVHMPERSHLREPPQVEMRELLLALADVLRRVDLNAQVAIRRDALSVRQRMSELLDRLGDGQFHRFESLFDAGEGRMGVVVTFLAVLELAKELLLDLVQDAPFAAIYVQSRATGGGDFTPDADATASPADAAAGHADGETDGETGGETVFDPEPGAVTAPPPPDA